MSSVIMLQGMLLMISLNPVVVMADTNADNKLKKKVGDIEFTDATIASISKTLSALSEVNIIPSNEASKVKATLSVTNADSQTALDIICKFHSLVCSYDDSISAYVLMTVIEYKRSLSALKVPDLVLQAVARGVDGRSMVIIKAAEDIQFVEVGDKLDFDNGSQVEIYKINDSRVVVKIHPLGQLKTLR